MKSFNLLQMLLIETCECYPDKVALITGKRQFTYSNILNLVRNMSSLYCRNGIKRGDRVVVKLGNTVESIVSFWACLFVDAIVSVIPSDSDDTRLLFILQDSGAKMYVTDNYSHLISNNMDVTVVVGNSDQMPTTVTQKTVVNFDINKVDDHSRFDYSFDNNELDLASIIYTSGSTGQPKGVMLSHRNMLSALFSINKYLLHSSKDIILSALPLSFDYGLYQMIMAFSVGATLVLEKDATWPMRLLKKIEDFKVTVLPLVPSLATLLYEHDNHFHYDYFTLRAITNTGANLSGSHIMKLKETFPSALIYSMYGLTECKRCTYLPPEDIDRKAGSIGKPIPNTEAWVVDDQGNKVATGKVGQLVIRGATVMKGYWNRPDETRKKLQAGLYCGEYILYTGDYVLCDEEGYYYFKGRMDEVIKYKGLKLSPVDLENKVSKIQGVKNVLVLGINDKDMDTSLVICVQIEEDYSIKLSQVKSSIISVLTQSQKTNHIYFIKSLPKSNNGKINKKIIQNYIKEKILCNNNQNSEELITII